MYQAVIAPLMIQQSSAGSGTLEIVESHSGLWGKTAGCAGDGQNDSFAAQNDRELDEDELVMILWKVFFFPLKSFLNF